MISAFNLGLRPMFFPTTGELASSLQNSLPVKSGQRIHEKQRMVLPVKSSRQVAAFYKFAASSSSKNLQRQG
jgi:hypothetical protein